MLPDKREFQPVNEEELDRLLEETGLTQEEYFRIKEVLKRTPNYLELSLYGAMWSEHCSYKHSKPLLRELPTEGEHVLQGPGENAGVIDIGDGMAVTFKVESHNHPSAVEPFQGAATGVGGILRDVFTMGARPVAVLDSLRFGPIKDDRTKFLLAGVIAGISHYGNCVGVPTVGGEVFFAESYRENPLVNAMAVGVMKKEHLTRASASLAGSPVMAVGTPTGRDGINGASFASANLSDDAAEDRPAVQVGDPFKEKLLLEACLELLAEDCVIGIQDMGAAGLLSSSCEMAARGGKGMLIELDNVPLREEGMTPREIMLSESQERMLVIPRPGAEEKVSEIFKKWNLEAEVIGRVTDDGLLTLRFKDEVVASIPAESLADGAIEVKKQVDLSLEKYQEKIGIEKKAAKDLLPEEPDNYNEILLKMFASPNLASKRFIFEQYDHMVQNNTVVLPGGDAAVLRVQGTNKGIAVTTDCNSRFCFLDPYRGAQIAVLEAARNIIATGAKPMAITDGLNLGSPKEDLVYYQFEKIIYGMKKACEKLNTPVVSGNVSFYNQTARGAIDPTPIIGMVGLLEDVNKYKTIDFKEAEHHIILIGKNNGELGGSEYLEWVHGLRLGPVPEIDWDLTLDIFDFLLSQSHLFSSIHDISEGGLAVALSEMALAGDLGCKIDLTNMRTGMRGDELLFGEDQSRFIVTIKDQYLGEFKEEAERKGLPYSLLGKTSNERTISIKPFINLPLTDLRKTYEEALPCYLEH